MDKARENRDLTKGNLLKKLIIYLLPLFLANILQLLFTTMDLFTVTHFGGGNISSGAIGATGSLINLILCTFWGITGGASIVIANAKGAKDYDKVTRSIGSCILIILICGLVVLVFGAILAKPLLQLLKTSDEFIDKSTTYLTIYFLGAPFNLLYNAGAAILRAFGDTKRPLIAVVISGIINVGLNFSMVFTLDVAGVAIATIASQAIAMLVVFYYLMFDKKLTANFKLKYLRFYKDESLDILRLGLTTGLQSFIFNFTNVNIQMCTNVLGPEAVIGKAASGNIDGYEYALLNSISTTCMVAVGQNYGAKDVDRMKKTLLYSILMELVIVTIFDCIIVLCRNPLLSIFISKDEPNAKAAIELATQALMIIGLPYALCGIPECCSGYLRGMKYSVAPTLVSLGCIVGFRLFFIYALFDIEYFHNFMWLMLTYPISWTLCCLVYIPVCIKLSKKKFKYLRELSLKEQAIEANF